MRTNTSLQNKVASSEAHSGVKDEATWNTLRSIRSRILLRILLRTYKTLRKTHTIAGTDLPLGGCCRNPKSIARVRSFAAEDDGRRYDSRQRARSVCMQAAHTCRQKLFTLHALTTRSDHTSECFLSLRACAGSFTGRAAPCAHPSALRHFLLVFHRC